MRRSIYLLMFSIALIISLSCNNSNGSNSSTTTEGSRGPAPSGAVDPAAGCGITMTVDDTTYNAIACTAQGWKTFSSGVYQITLSGAFNIAGAHRPVRSVSFVVWDDSDPAATHIGNFPAITGAEATPPHYVSAAYNRTFMDVWNTHAGAGATQTAIGSGSMNITQYDKANKKISGTFSFVVKQGAASKTITGSFTNVNMTRAD